MSENDPSQELPVVRTANLLTELREFSMDLAPTPENVEKVKGQVLLIGELARSVHRMSMQERGKRLNWLKPQLEHGEWLKFLEGGAFPIRSAQRWMAIARDWEERGQKRYVSLLQAPDVRFSEAGDAEDLDPDDLADPSKPPPVPRNVLQKQVLRLQKQVESLQERDEKAQVRVRELQDTLKAREDSSLGAEIRRSPVKYKLIQAQLLLGQADQGLRDLDDEALLKEFDGEVLQYRGVLRAVQEVVDGIMMEHGMRIGAKLEAHVEPDDFKGR